MLPSETMIWQPEFTDKTLSRKPGVVHYAWRSKLQQQMSSSERESELAAENARLKRQLAEQAEELAILQKAATYFANRLK